MRALALQAIMLYRRHLSPRKGFTCAHARHDGGATCSAFGLRAIRRFGVWRGLPILRERLHLCGDAYRAQRTRPPLRQRGDCDPGCDLPGDCDLPEMRSGSGCCDVGHCDWSRRTRKDHHGGPNRTERRRLRREARRS